MHSWQQQLPICMLPCSGDLQQLDSEYLWSVKYHSYIGQWLNESLGSYVWDIQQMLQGSIDVMCFS